MARVVETDICIIGSGITAAMVAEKLADEREASITVVEAGDRPIPLAERARWWRRYVEYGDSPWPDDHLDGQDVVGRPHGYSPSFLVGGLAMHWGAVTPRFSPEDFRVRSLYGVGDDWPLRYEELEPAYREAEARMGVAGEPGPADLDPRGAPYPMPPLPLTYNLLRLKEWAESSGTPFWAMPSAKNSVAYGGRAACCRNDTCWPICPVGAKYSPDFTFDTLEETGRAQVVARTLVRRLVLAQGSDRVERAEAVDRDAPDDPLHVHARTFVVAAGYVWSSHLLLLSADPRHPAGLANSSGLVGKYLAGHRAVHGFARVPFQLYPGMANQHSLLSQRFMRSTDGGAGEPGRYLRHDFRIWESAVEREPRLRDDEGRLLWGDELLADWRGRALGGGTARLRAYYDVLPARESQLSLDATARNPWGDPLPRVSFQDDADSAGLRPYSEESIAERFRSVARTGGGTIFSIRSGSAQEHPGGGCRMGDDPSNSVVDAFGRSHDHENLFIVGAPAFVTAGCTNGTLTMAALGIRAAEAIGIEYPVRAV